MFFLVKIHISYFEVIFLKYLRYQTIKIIFNLITFIQWGHKPKKTEERQLTNLIYAC